VFLANTGIWILESEIQDLVRTLAGQPVTPVYKIDLDPALGLQIALKEILKC